MKIVRINKYKKYRVWIKNIFNIITVVLVSLSISQCTYTTLYIEFGEYRL